MSAESLRDQSDQPMPTADVGDDEIVSVLMERRLARTFERRCLPVACRLVGPLDFGDDIPTFIIEAGDR